MNVLLVGSGGREHALAWKILKSPRLQRLVVAPGNPGIAALCETRPVSATDVEGLVAAARDIQADLVVVGPEATLEAGLADDLAKAGIACFGPTAAAARLESSKVFLKAFAERHGLPTARHQSFGDAAAAKAGLDDFVAPFVIKADGLAAGKGVVIAASRSEAEAAIEAVMDGRLGAAGSRIVVEEFMTGEEVSLFALCDGRTTRFFGAAQDHKRAYDHDVGPNTGGMGAYSPAAVLTAQAQAGALSSLVEPTALGMRQEGAPYRGVLFAGLMIKDDRARLVEFNARFGDPECQILMLRLESDVLEFLLATAEGRLASMPEPVWSTDAVICVVLAAHGYPGDPLSGTVIRGADQDFGDGVVVFHAGTARRPDGALVAAGGRVLNVCARGPSLEAARDRAYQAIARIDWPEGFYRTDIGWRGLASR